ncbi:MAG: tail fiber domain-containing protein [Ferruginibacter sp.]
MRIFICIFCVCISISSFAQYVGIGTANPIARLHVADSNVLFSGPTYLTSPAANPPASSPGVKLLWYTAKAAFRAGAVYDNSWDKDSIGFLSLGFGYNPKAKGDYSIAMGLDAVADQTGVAIGIRTKSFGAFATAMGNDTRAMGYQSTALGYQTTASGHTSLATGYLSRAGGIYTTAMGFSTIANNDMGTTIGKFNDTSNNSTLFEVGNGTGNTQRKNALVVLQNSRTGIGTSFPAARLHVADSNVLFSGPALYPPSSPTNPPASGPGTRMMWYPDKAAFRTGTVSSTEWDKDNIGVYSFAAGRDNIASGFGAVTLGFANKSVADYTFTAGNTSIATGSGAVAIGSGAVASGFGATSIGYQTVANGLIATALGRETASRAFSSTSMGGYTKAKSDYSLVIGKYNDTTATDRLFEIGYGTADNDRRNAVTVINNGNVGIGATSPLRPLSFPAVLGEKILLYPGSVGEVGIGVYGNELRLHSDNAGARVTFGTQTNAGVFTEAGRFEISGGYALRVNGSIWANGTTYSSDARFKKNIATLPGALQKIMQLRGVSYEMMAEEYPSRNFTEGRQIGLLAQEVEAVVPEIVSTGDDGYKSVDYAKLVPVLIEAIKTQQEQIVELQKQVEQLKKK